MIDCLPEKDYIAQGWHKLFEGRQSVVSHSYKVDNCFIISNVLHSIIIIWSSSNLTTDTKWWPIFSCAVDITMQPNVQRLIKQNVKCHVMFFRLINFNISIWVCNEININNFDAFNVFFIHLLHIKVYG